MAVPWGSRWEQELLPWHTSGARDPADPAQPRCGVGSAPEPAARQLTELVIHLPLRAPLPSCSLSQLCGGGSGSSSGGHTGHTGTAGTPRASPCRARPGPPAPR